MELARESGSVSGVSSVLGFRCFLIRVELSREGGFSFVPASNEVPVECLRLLLCFFKSRDNGPFLDDFACFSSISVSGILTDRRRASFSFPPDIRCSVSDCSMTAEVKSFLVPSACFSDRASTERLRRLLFEDGPLRDKSPVSGAAMLRLLDTD